MSKLMGNNNQINIYILSNDETIKYAAAELSKYLKKITGQKVKMKLQHEYNKNTHALWLGTFRDFPEKPHIVDELDSFDDMVSIDTEGTKGIISGLCPRSVLLSVYRYLNILGCRFLFPGEEGEILPLITLENTRVKLFEKPSYKYRSVCIEGAVSLENVIEMIDWLPKIGFNSYFIQFREAYIFFKRWYRHIGNPFMESEEEFPIGQAREYVHQMNKEIKKRGLIHQAVGHGWTCEPFGLPGLSFSKYDGKISEDTLKNFALVNGERKLIGDVPINTNACYSNKEVRKKIIDDVCNYAIAHKDIDIIHFWLADGSNNQCECETCIERAVSDEYVSILNELDLEMNRLEIKTKIAFIIYSDTLFPPVHERLKNQERVILIFAPISRSYRRSFSLEDELPEIPKYIKNHISLPTSVAENITFLKGWQKNFAGDGIDFDYHYMWAHHTDPGGFQISRVLYEDINNLQNFGLNGFISCQVQRAIFPNALGMTVMGNTLWNKNISYEDIVQDFFRCAYGENWDRVKNYLEQLSKLYYQLNLEDKNPVASPDKSQLCCEIIKIVADFKQEISRLFIKQEKRLTLLWQYLNMHSDIWLDMTNIFKHIYDGNKGTAKENWKAVKLKLWEDENEYQKAFDVFNFTRTIDTIINYE